MMAEEMTESEIMDAAESIHDGWYADSSIDWEDFIDRLEASTEFDFGNDIDSPLIRRVKAHVRKYRRIAP
jgi:hypothetical protein